MKKMVTLGLAISSISFNAFAVETKNCPKILSFSYSHLDFLNDAQVIAAAENTAVTSEDALKSIHKLRNIQTNQFQNVKLKLVSTKYSKCDYYPVSPTSESGDGNQWSRLYTKDGQNILRLSIQTKNESYWIFHTVIAYTPQGIAIKNDTKKIYGTDNGHEAPVVKMGYASGVNINDLTEME